MKKIFVLIFLSILVAGCTETKEEILHVKVPGHPEVYQFSYNIRDTVNIPTETYQEIRNELLGTSRIVFVMNVTDTDTISGHYSITVVNFIQKLKGYQLYNGNIVDKYVTYVYDNQKAMWIDPEGEIVPDFNGAVIWFVVGEPASVNLENGIIYVKSDTLENLPRSGDKLALIMLNINDETLDNA
jgi:hypothetical protein